MRVLLTGHQGYLGTMAASALVSAGHLVTGLDAGELGDDLRPVGLLAGSERA